MEGVAQRHNHIHGGGTAMVMAGMASNATNTTQWHSDPPYFTLPDHSGLLVAHVVLMTLAWVFILPICVMLSIGQSRLTFLFRTMFLAVNVGGLVVGTVYNSSTPDLYENNAHHKIGWIATWIFVAQSLLSLLGAYSRKTNKHGIISKSQFKQEDNWRNSESYRYSHDSGQGTEPSSPRTSDPSQIHTPDVKASDEFYEINAVAPGGEDVEKLGLLGNTTVDRFLAQKIKNIASGWAVRIARVTCDVIDRVILILAFVALATGIVTYGGYFKGHEIFSGLAHFVKGGIFFWYGLLVLGRALGSFADLGWSWNLKPDASIVGRRKAAVPTAEFLESLLIFTYGSTNVFLEHLGATDDVWSATDLEHASISVMFFGGGLCGMLIESRTIRDYLNAALASAPGAAGLGASLDSWKNPRTYGFSLNPLPAIIIMLLGIMMSGHHQASMVSTMLHAQWGSLFAVAAVARGVTYILVYLSPPTSYLPSRPPSELVVAFCLISGGLIFMCSNSDMVTAMEMFDLNAMFLFTVAMGATAFLMAWEILVLAAKGWAVRREHGQLLPVA